MKKYITKLMLVAVCGLCLLYDIVWLGNAANNNPLPFLLILHLAFIPLLGVALLASIFLAIWDHEHRGGCA